MAAREAGGLGGRAVGGAIVYYEDFRRGETRLVQVLDNTAERRGQALLFVVSGDYD
jgi:hypothetical protein